MSLGKDISPVLKGLGRGVLYVVKGLFSTLVGSICFALKALFGAFFGFLGVLLAVIVVVGAITYVVGPGPLLSAVGRMLPSPTSAPPPSGRPGGMSGEVSGGPEVMTTPTLTPSGPLPTLELWLTSENRPDAPQLAAFKADEEKLHLGQRSQGGAGFLRDVAVLAR